MTRALTLAVKRERLLARLMANTRLDETTGCWIWTACISSEGYGRAHARIVGEENFAHRVMFTLLVGPIPAGMTIDHLCHTNDLTCPGGKTCPHRRCVNPAHLEIVTRGVNTQRGCERVTRCPQGHPYDEANTWRRPNGRVCRSCERDRHQRRRDAAKRKAAA